MSSQLAKLQLTLVEQEEFHCIFCDKAIRKKICTETKHYLKHIHEYPYTCKLCEAGFHLKSTRDRHVKLKTCLTGHRKRIYRCKVCEQSFRVQSTLRTHEMRDHPSIYKPAKELKCKQCNKQFFTISGLKFHMRDIHNSEATKKVLKCDMCDRKFRRQRTLDVHRIRKHLGKKSLCCDLCGKLYWSETELRNHLRLHTGEQPYKCRSCGKTFTNISNWKYHESLHSRKTLQHRPHFCYNCNKRFINLFKHIREEHQDHGQFSCSKCERKLCKTGALIQHWKTHNPSFRAELLKSWCIFCGKGFPNKNQLWTHLLYHIQERPYSCHVCGESFMCESNLASHFRGLHGRNSKPRPFKCLKCCVYLADRKQLESHDRRVHESKGNIQCPICGMKISTPQNLLRHEKLHDRKAELKHCCVFCGKGFLSNYELSNHLHTHTREEPFLCHLCGESARQLRHHIKMAHGPELTNESRIE